MPLPGEPLRPLHRFGIDVLRKYFEDNSGSTEQLKVLLEELTHRDTRMAIALRAKVEAALGPPKGAPPATSDPAPSKSLLESQPGGSAEPAANPLNQETGKSSPEDETLEVDFDVLKKEGIEKSRTFIQVQVIAEQLRLHLNEGHTQQLIRERHVHSAHSTGIQDAILEKLTQLGFQDEKQGLFSTYEVRGLRPDYFCRVENTGILLEVERGKTLANNMDLLDLWKCHICHHANYLFLVVPKVRQTEKGGGVPQFSQVRKRLAPFFEPRNYVNVDAVHLFGY